MLAVRELNKNIISYHVLEAIKNNNAAWHTKPSVYFCYTY